MSVSRSTPLGEGRTILAGAPAAAHRRLLLRMTLAALSVGALLAGCTVGPDYKAPATTLPDQFGEYHGHPSAIATMASLPVIQKSARPPSTGEATATSAPTTFAAEAGPINLERWWNSFDDPELNSLIARAVKANYSVEIAVSKVRQAREERTIAAGPLFPSLNVTGDYNRSRGSNDPKQHIKPVNESYQAGLDASWEIDIFGGTRRAVESAEYNIDAAVENQRFVLITVMGEVALDYIELRGTQAQLAITLQSLKAQEDTLSLTESRFRAGLTGDQDVANARSTVEQTASSVPSQEASIDQSIHAISVLLSVDPSALTDELSVTQPLPLGPPKVPPGLPSELVRRRPDVRLAERQIGAANAQIGVAIADLFPKFSLNASIGQSNSQFKRLFDYNSRFNSIGPSMNWDVFSAGALQAGVEVNKEATLQSLLNYKQTVLTSLQEVEDALVVYDREQIRNQHLASAVDASLRAFNISSELYSKGLQDFLSVLTSQEQLFGSQEALASSNTQMSVDLVTLYKALGGGWENIDDNTPEAKIPPATAPSNDTAVIPQ